MRVPHLDGGETIRHDGAAPGCDALDLLQRWGKLSRADRNAALMFLHGLLALQENLPDRPATLNPGAAPSAGSLHPRL